MFGLFKRRWATPVFRPMAPFIFASGITFYLVWQMNDMGIRSDAFAKDPRNPWIEEIAKEKEAQAHH